MNSVIRYFDLNRDIRPKHAMGVSDEEKQVSWQIQYFALLLGIVIQPYFAYFQQHREWKLDALSGWILFSIIVALVCFPGLYRNSFDPKKPVFLQLIPIFTAGLGWQSLFATAMKSAGG